MLPNVLASNQCDHARWTVSVKGVEVYMARNLRKKKYLHKGKGESTGKIKVIKRRELLSTEYMRIEIGKATPSGWTLLETTTLYYAITYLQVRGEEVDLFSVVAMYNNITTYSQREFDCQYQANSKPQKQIVDEK